MILWTVGGEFATFGMVLVVYRVFLAPPLLSKSGVFLWEKCGIATVWIEHKEEVGDAMGEGE